MKIFSLIVTFNAMRHNWIYKCLDSLLSSDLSTEIIVVDNASTDETCQVIKDRYPSVILIENRENKGFGAANNQGFEYGIKNNADYFFLLNQDAWIEKGCIQQLVNVAEINLDFGVISPLHLNGKGDALDYNFSNYIGPASCPGLYSDFILGRAEKKIYPAKFVNAAAWLLPRKSLEIVGGFSPAFFHYGEDDNYCQRVLFHQLKIGVYPFTRIFHDRESRILTPDVNNSKERTWKLKYSNPSVDCDIRSEITYLRKNLFKNKVMRRGQSVKNDRAELNFLEVEVPKLEIYRQKSQSPNSYTFLNL